MTNKEKKEWLSVKYPLTIIRDRYDGVYSRACWLAFPLDYDEIPEDVTGDDVVCSLFWKTYKEPVGKGAYANDAVIDLMERMAAPEFPEWSEEDERILKGIIGLIDHNQHYGVGNKEMLAWLKSLRPQPKKSEYITSHKEFFKWIYDRLVSVHKENPNADYMISFKKRIEELSFDNPSWKPSEEQMEALEYVIRDYREDSCNATADYLQEILDHLKNM